MKLLKELFDADLAKRKTFFYFPQERERDEEKESSNPVKNAIKFAPKSENPTVDWISRFYCDSPLLMMMVFAFSPQPNFCDNVLACNGGLIEFSFFLFNSVVGGWWCAVKTISLLHQISCFHSAFALIKGGFSSATQFFYYQPKCLA